jgi:hypothetical protein
MVLSGIHGNTLFPVSILVSFKSIFESNYHPIFTGGLRTCILHTNHPLQLSAAN